jgi:hypothetical protein
MGDRPLPLLLGEDSELESGVSPLREARAYGETLPESLAVSGGFS